MVPVYAALIIYKKDATTVLPPYVQTVPNNNPSMTPLELLGDLLATFRPEIQRGLLSPVFTRVFLPGAALFTGAAFLTFHKHGDTKIIKDGEPKKSPPSTHS